MAEPGVYAGRLSVDGAEEASAAERPSSRAARDRCVLGKVKTEVTALLLHCACETLLTDKDAGV